MSNDDSRGLESPDRPHASTPTARASDGKITDDSIRERLESITELTRSILTDVRTADETTELAIDDETYRETTRRLREIDAEAMRVGLELFGSGVMLPERSDDGDPPTVIGCDSLTTTYRGPAPGTVDDVERADDPTHEQGDRDGE
ncbi:hypothetical protein [Natrinema sp. SYSU A 869]|uniref:hypothetical protein n=1 Tax=Natrinema sp. SYSU A 869 TaxID=2871694 RepID=UPI001CA4691D|nr:hypothetical protein [Natrinema sp. SYSU A 869]